MYWLELFICIIYQPSPACSKRSASAETMYKSDRPASLRCCGTIGWLLCIPQVKDNFQPSSYREYHVVVVSFNSSTIFLSYRLITSSSCILLFRLTYLCISLVLERLGLKKNTRSTRQTTWQHDNITQCRSLPLQLHKSFCFVLAYKVNHASS